MLNSVNIIGRIINEPTLRMGSGFGKYCSIVIAFDQYFSPVNEKKYTYTVTCCAFGETAEKLIQSVEKGTVIGVTGKLARSHFYDKNNKLVTDLFIQVDTYIIMQPAVHPTNNQMYIQFGMIKTKKKKKEGAYLEKRQN